MENIGKNDELLKLIWGSYKIHDSSITKICMQIRILNCVLTCVL